MYKVIKERQNLEATIFPYVKGATIKRINEEEDDQYTLLEFNDDGILSKEIYYNKGKKVYEKNYIYENNMLTRIIKDSGNVKRFKDFTYMNGILCIENEKYYVENGDFKLVQRTKRLEKDGNTIFYQEIRDNIIVDTQTYNYDNIGRMIFKSDNFTSMRFLYEDEISMFPNRVIVNNSDIINIVPSSARTARLVHVNLPRFDKPRYFVVNENNEKICSIDFMFKDELVYINNKLVYNPNNLGDESLRIGNSIIIEDNKVIEMEDYIFEY